MSETKVVPVDVIHMVRMLASCERWPERFPKVWGEMEAGLFAAASTPEPSEQSEANKEIKFQIHDGQVICANAWCGAVLCPDDLWRPFRFFDSGELDVYDDEEFVFLKPSSAYQIACMIFT